MILRRICDEKEKISYAVITYGGKSDGIYASICRRGRGKSCYSRRRTTEVKSAVPRTGDSNHIWLMLVMALGSAGVVAVMGYRRKVK